MHADEKHGVPERVLVVEYKGADRITNDDSKEKKRIGELWAARSEGKALFAMVSNDDVESIRTALKSLN